MRNKVEKYFVGKFIITIVFVIFQGTPHKINEKELSEKYFETFDFDSSK